MAFLRQCLADVRRRGGRFGRPCDASRSGFEVAARQETTSLPGLCALPREWCNFDKESVAAYGSRHDEIHAYAVERLVVNGVDGEMATEAAIHSAARHEADTDSDAHSSAMADAVPGVS